MDKIYRETVTLTDFHLDCFRRLKPSAMLLFIQNMAEHHASRLGAGWHALAEKHLFWALIRHKIQITRLPEADETITLETWPMPTTRVAYPRSVVAYDEKGNELFRSISLWVLMDENTRAMILPGKSGVEVAGTLTGAELPVPRAVATRPMENVAVKTVGYTLLDQNGHMNNTRYMDWVDDLLPAAFHAGHPVQEFTVCYLSEAREGEEIHLHYELSDGPTLTVDAQRQGAHIFSAQLLY